MINGLLHVFLCINFNGDVVRSKVEKNQIRLLSGNWFYMVDQILCSIIWASAYSDIVFRGKSFFLDSVDNGITNKKDFFMVLPFAALCAVLLGLPSSLLQAAC